jgi:SAM-dependent methyltransferase
MPYSSGAGKAETLDFLLERDIDSVLDVGVGAGAYSELLREGGFEGRLDGVEVFEKYVEFYDLEPKYDRIVVADIRDHCTQDFSYDAIILGDVLEHLPRDEALIVLEALARRCRFLVVSMPTGGPSSRWYEDFRMNWGPDDWHGNVHENHVYAWSHEEFAEETRALGIRWQASYYFEEAELGLFLSDDLTRERGTTPSR